MSDKYIIKNCPSTYQNFEDKFVCTTQIKQKEFPCYCQDCTDCLLKQIVELCKRTLSINKGSDNEFTLGKMTFAEFILKDIDIQEAE